MARRQSVSQEQGPNEEDALRKEVASFISAEVGLSSHAQPDGLFDDFAPENATKKLGEADAAPKWAKKSKNKFKPDTGDKPLRATAEARNIQTDVCVAERSWNEGAGQRPGGKGKVLVEHDDSSVWYEVSATLSSLKGAPGTVQADVVQTKTGVAQKLMELETERYQKKLSRTNAADAQWLQTVRKSGTTRDQIAANALLVEQSAIHNTRALDELISLSCKRGGAQAAAGHAVDALKQLFIEHLLPDRRLVAFDARPLHHVKPSKAGDKRLLYWWMEDCVKRRYSTFLQALEDLSLGNLEWAKQKALKAAYELLAAKPEQEARLLTITVNKLGDPNRRMASNAGYLISCLLTKHPLMSTVVVREIEAFLFRPNQKARAVYYAAITLNQMVLSHHNKHGTPVANKLIDIYFSLFHLVLEHKIGNAAQNQQQPEASPPQIHSSSAAPSNDSGGHGDNEESDRDGDEDFDEDDMHDAHAHGVKKTADKAKSRKASFLAQRKAKSKGKGGRKERMGNKHGKNDKGAKGAPTDSRGQALTAEVVDARMLSALISGVRRAFPYVDSEQLEGVFAKHADKLFRTVHVAPLTVSVQALMLLFQVMTSQSAVNDRFHNALYATLLRPGLERSSTLPMLFGLLFQALSADVSARRVAAFIKRVLQFAGGAPANVACSALIVVSEVLKLKPVLWAAVLEPEDRGIEELHDAADATTDADVSEKEHSDEDSDDSDERSKGGRGPGGRKTERHAVSVPAERRTVHKWPGEDYYDITKRAPQFARAERACWWELCCLSAHVHPSVSAMAGALLSGTSIVYGGDPLSDLTPLAFLDKFVKRKPKRGDKGTSAMQPVVSHEGTGPSSGRSLAGTLHPGDAASLPGSAAFSALAAEDVKAEDVFFHRYFTLENVQRRRAHVARTKSLTKKKKSGDEGSDDDMWDGDDCGSDADGSEDGSDAEDDFLEGLETLQDRSLGDPALEVLTEALRADFTSDAERAVDEESSGGDEDGAGEKYWSDVDGADINFVEDGTESTQARKGRSKRKKSESSKCVAASLEEPSKGADTRASDGEVAAAAEEGAFDDAAFMKALFGAAAGPGSSDQSGSDEDLQMRVIEQGEEGEENMELGLPGEHGSGHGGKHNTSKVRKAKRQNSGGVLASYKEYAHLLDQYDEVNQQPFPDEQVQGEPKVRQQKQRKFSVGSGSPRRRKS